MPSSDTQRAHIHLEKLKNTEKSLPAAEVSAAFADPYFAQSGCDALPAIYWSARTLVEMLLLALGHTSLSSGF